MSSSSRHALAVAALLIVSAVGRRRAAAAFHPAERDLESGCQQRAVAFEFGGDDDASRGPWRPRYAAVIVSRRQIGSGCWGRYPNLRFPARHFVLRAARGCRRHRLRPIVAEFQPSYYSPDCDDPARIRSFRCRSAAVSRAPVRRRCLSSCNDASSDDCHLLVVNDDDPDPLRVLQRQQGRCDRPAYALCALSWDLTRVYPRYGRGEHCTSADARRLSDGAADCSTPTKCGQRRSRTATSATRSASFSATTA